MKILVANVGSTSFKYRLYKITDDQETLLAKGGFERVTDYGTVIDESVQNLITQGDLKDANDLDAVGFKTVLGKNLTGCLEADDQVLDALEGFAAVAPAHNPPYAAAIRQFRERMPHTTRVALFETAFYQWVPPAASTYAVPQSWQDIGIKRYGFHGASHKFIAERSAELTGRDDIAHIAKNLYVHGHREPDTPPLRVVSCHLGGSSSITGILNGRAIGASMGFSPQSGLPQNNRVGELDSGALPYVLKTLDIDLAEAERQMTKESGLLALSGISNDMRDIHKAATEGNQRAQLALDHLIHSTKHWIGAFAFQMGGLDALVFTAGIGENNPWLRTAITDGLENFGLKLDPTKNDNCTGDETALHADDSKIQAYVIPANEELVIAREVHRYMQTK